MYQETVEHIKSRANWNEENKIYSLSNKTWQGLIELAEIGEASLVVPFIRYTIIVLTLIGLSVALGRYVVPANRPIGDIAGESNFSLVGTDYATLMRELTEDTLAKVSANPDTPYTYEIVQERGPGIYEVLELETGSCRIVIAYLLDERLSSHFLTNNYDEELGRIITPVCTIPSNDE